MRRILIAVPLALVALIGGLGLWGTTLPRDHRVASRVTIAAPPESVYNVLRDQASLPTWWAEVETIVAVPGTDGWERWRETMGGNEITFIIAEEEPGVAFVTAIDTTGGSPFGGTWHHRTELAAGSGTTLTVTEDGWVNNPFFRVAMQIGGPYTTLDSYLTALGTRFGESVTPVHVEP